MNTKIRINPDVSNIFIGDSHVELAFNDSIIPDCKNVATNSESYYFSYYKLKKLLEDNPSIKYVFLGFSFHNISNYYDRFISGNFSYTIAPKYFATLPIREQLRLIYWNRTNFSPFVRGLLKNCIKQNLNPKNSTILGGYSNQFNETMAVDSSMNKRLEFQYFFNDELNSFSDLNIQYLDKIITLCKDKNVKLTVVNTPLHRFYYQKIPIEYVNKLNEIVKTNHLDYIDFSNLELSDNNFIPDGDHVSVLGSEKVSIKMKEIIYN